MKTKETEQLDALIKETLSKEEAAFYEELEEKNLFGKISEVYKCKMGWLAISMNIMHLVLTGVLVYCIIRFFDTESLKAMLTWSSAGFCCLVFMSMMKLYVWMQMDKNDVLRELKRVELQVSVLAHKMAEKETD